VNDTALEHRAVQERTPIFVVMQAMPGRDPIRALRWLLKSALRQHGLRCIEAREEAPTPAIAASGDEQHTPGRERV
jgi:hypothetical protein